MVIQPSLSDFVHAEILANGIDPASRAGASELNLKVASPAPSPRNIVVVGNLGSDRSKQFAIHPFGRRQLCFAPKHSPDLNLIEGVSANLNRSKR